MGGGGYSREDHLEQSLKKTEKELNDLKAKYEAALIAIGELTMEKVLREKWK